MARRFYLSEAESLLPQVSAWIQEAVFLKSQCQEAENKIEALSQKVMLYGGMIVDRERARLSASAATIPWSNSRRRSRKYRRPVAW